MYKSSEEINKYLNILDDKEKPEKKLTEKDIFINEKKTKIIKKKKKNKNKK